MQKMKKVVIIGLGYVGLPLALLSKKNGYDVTGIDRDKSKVEAINNKTSPFKDIIVDKTIKEFPIHATQNFDAVSKADTIVICVPTPVDEEYKPDLEPVISSCTGIGNYLKKGQLIILESTVNPGTMKETVIPVLEKTSGLIAGKDFYLAHCPERINPGGEKWNVENIDRVVGGLNETSLRKAKKFYASILKANIMEMCSIEEAEAVKILENCFRDVNLALVNEFAMSFDKLGIDVLHVINGAATKPFSFLPHYPGCGVGGNCIPVDPYYMINYAKSKGFDHKILSLARETNNGMPSYTVNLLLNIFRDKKINIKNAKVAVLGIAYKKNIGDSRESPSFRILDLLKKNGANVKVYDPFILAKSNADSLDDALSNVDAVIIATDHDEFTKLTPKMLIDKNVHIVVDGRNCLNKDDFINEGIAYKGIGR